jgi:signal transduction histidine kinase
MGGTLAAKLILKLDAVSELAGIRDILQTLADHFGACGVLLWEVAPGIHPAEGRRLFVQGQYFEGDVPPPFFELPMDSISAQAIRSGKSVTYARHSGAWPVRVTFEEPLDRLKIVAFATIPIQLRGGTKGDRDAALTFYRKSGPFQEEEVADLEEAGRLFPAIYRAVLNTVSLRLLTSVQHILGLAHYPQDSRTGGAKAHDTLQTVVGIIKQHFRAREISIFLRDPAAEPETFDLIASEWPWSAREIKRYTFGEGGTGWVLKTGKPLQLLDLSHYEEDRAYYAHKYPGMAWSDRAGVVAEVCRQREPGQGIPPLSYVCVPILYPGQVYGAIRCFRQESGPYYFDDDLTQALCSVADLVGDWWVHWLAEGNEIDERARLLELLSQLAKTNREALAQLAGPEKHPGEIAALVLRACHELTPEVDVFQTWMKDAERDELYMTAELDAADPTRAGPCRQAAAPLAHDLPDGKRNALYEAWHRREPTQVQDTHSKNNVLALPDKPGCRAFTVAPIVAEDVPTGILVALSHNRVHRQPSIMTTVKFIARQLALYEALRQQLRRLQQSQRELQESLKAQGDLLLDFQHQVRSPVNMAYAHAEILLAKSPKGSGGTLQIIMEASRRASSVASNLKLFIDLAREHPVLAHIVDVKPSDVIPKLQRAASNLYSQKALDKKLKFEVDGNWRTAMRPFKADPERLELVFDNLLDNAVKYSFANTIVRISAGLSPDGSEVYISFRNRGLRIEPKDLDRLTQRGHRGSQAQQSHPEGAGIGLWMAAKVLKSMQGRIEIIPTNPAGVNDFRVWLKRS